MELIGIKSCCTPYILMGKVDGTPPFVVWRKESGDRRLKILDNLAKFHARFAHPLAIFAYREPFHSVILYKGTQRTGRNQKFVLAFRISDSERGTRRTESKGPSLAKQ
jgi:hypothetical protein